MSIKMILGAATALAMTATPIAASAAPAAASLSVAKSVRTGATTSGKSKAAGGGLAALLIGAGVVAIGVIAIVNDGDDSDSN